MHLVRNSMWLVIVAVMLNSWSCSSSDIQADRYIAAVQSFADRVLESGRDNFGDVKTPLFVDGMHVQSLDPGTWKGPEGDTWVLSNLASQQPLF